MKTKRCTNSSCRKVFRVESHECPHCGKGYPRVNSPKYAVVLTHEGTCVRSDLYGAIRSSTNLGMGPGKKLALLLTNTPSLVATDLTHQQANKCRKNICKAGADAKIISANKGTRGIFVLPEQAG